MLIDAIQSQDDQKGNEESVVFDLVRLLTDRPAAELARVAQAARSRWRSARRPPVTRQLGFVALIAADGGVDKAWELANAVDPGSAATCSPPCRWCATPTCGPASIPRSSRS